MIDPKPTTNPTPNTTMNETNTPEPLSAILAEMREAGRSDEHADGPLIEDYADRIEAAAEREREEAKNYFAKLHDGPSMICTAKNCAVRNIGLSLAAAPRKFDDAAPGNAAALREALDSIADIAKDAFGGPERHREASQGRALSLIVDTARDALAAPARNCDRFQTAADAVAAFADHIRAWENAHGIHSEYPDHPVQVPAGAFAWLFAPAEGGSHA